jgi:hypothetical protein
MKFVILTAFFEEYANLAYYSKQLLENILLCKLLGNLN